MRILARKTFRLDAGLDSYITIPGAIQDVPDKFAASMMFKLAVQEGSIQQITTSEQLRDAENDQDAGAPAASEKPARRRSSSAKVENDEAAEKKDADNPGGDVNE